MSGRAPKLPRRGVCFPCICGLLSGDKGKINQTTRRGGFLARPRGAQEHRRIWLPLAPVDRKWAPLWSRKLNNKSESWRAEEKPVWPQRYKGISTFAKHSRVPSRFYSATTGANALIF